MSPQWASVSAKTQSVAPGVPIVLGTASPSAGKGQNQTFTFMTLNYDLTVSIPFAPTAGPKFIFQYATDLGGGSEGHSVSCGVVEHMNLNVPNART